MYLRQSPSGSTKKDEWKKNPSYPAYYREFKNVTIKAAEGAAVTCDGIVAEAGNFWKENSPASNHDEMLTGSDYRGFVSYLVLENISIEGITFDDTSRSAIVLRSNVSDAMEGADILVNDLTVKNCTATGDGSANIHFFVFVGKGCDKTFRDTGKTAINNIKIIRNTINKYCQAICFNNNTNILTGLTVTDNTFNDCDGNVIQLSNKENRGTFTFTGNRIIRSNGRFIRMTTPQAATKITISGNRIESPRGFDEDGIIVKISGGVNGFAVTETSNNWAAGSFNEDRTLWTTGSAGVNNGEQQPSTGGYYYYDPTTDTKADDAKGSPKTFDAGIGIYAVTAVLSVTGMAWTAKKRH